MESSTGVATVTKGDGCTVSDWTIAAIRAAINLTSFSD